MQTINKEILCMLLSLPLSCSAMGLKHGMIPVQLGGFISSPGTSQHINIEGLVGNLYTVQDHHTSNGLFGIGYYMHGADKERFELNYGINGFYFGKSSVSGSVVQEDLFTNLTYNYSIHNLPVYLAAKAIVKNTNKQYNVTLDAGIGPNFIKTSHYSEGALNSFSLPSNGFAGDSRVAFSAMAGIGVRLNEIFGKAPLECGYRFFYLGAGQLNPTNNQILNRIKTGNNYANGFICSVTA